MDAGLAAPADDEDAGHAVDVAVEQGSHGVDDVALAGVLHVDHGDLAGGQMVTGGDGGAVALVGGDDVVLAVHTVGAHQVVAQGLQLGIGDAGEKVSAQGFYKIFNFHLRILSYIAFKVSRLNATGLFFRRRGLTESARISRSVSRFLETGFSISS